MKKITLTLIICSVVTLAFSQNSTRTTCHEKFIGTWIATQDSSIYELELQIRYIKDTCNELESCKQYIAGSIRKTTRGTLDFFWDIQHDQEVNTFYPLCGTLSSPDDSHLSMNYLDMQILQKGILAFSINAKENTATWKLSRDKKYDLVSSKYPQTFKIPVDLIFSRKKEPDKK